VIENRGFRTRRIDGRRMSRFLDCGSTMTGAVADSYQVAISVRSTVDAVAETTASLTTEVEGTAQSRETRSGGLHCTSTGALERLIAERVEALLGDDE
jgi:hypothetical protein